MAKRVSKRQIEFIKSNYQILSNKELAQVLGVDKKTVRKELKRLNLMRTKEEERTIREKKRTKETREELMTKPTPVFIRKKHLIAILLIALVGFLVYANSFQNEFVWDDESLVEKNIYVKNLRYFSKLFTTHLFQAAKKEGNFYRPIQSLTYVLDYSIWKLNPFGYHLTNTILHILVAILIYFFLRGLVTNEKIPTSQPPDSKGKLVTRHSSLVTKLSCFLTVPFLTALFFVVHPIHTEAVTYISGRADSLASIFCLLSLIFSLKYTHQRRLPFYLLSLCSFILALLSKEWAMILPFALVLTDSFFGTKREIKTKIKEYFPFFITLGIYISLRLSILNFTGETILSSKYSLYVRTLTFLKVIPSYFGLLIFPHNLHMERLVPYAHSILEPKVLFSLILLIFIVIGVTKLKRKETTFAFFWFFLTLFPQSNIIPINATMAEHFLYLPSIGFFILFALGIVKVEEWGSRYLSHRIKVMSFLLLLLLTLYGVATIKQNLYWRDGLTLYQRTLAYSPKSARLHLNLGIAYREQKQYDLAISEYQKAIQLNPDYAEAHNNLGTVYRDEDLYNQAITEYQKALQLNPDFAEAYNNLGNVYRDKGLYDQAISEYQKAIRLNPDFAEAYNNLGNVYKDKGLYDRAISEYQKAIQLNPDFAEAYNNLGVVYAKIKQYHKAREAWEEALKLDPNLKSAQENLKKLDAMGY